LFGVFFANRTRPFGKKEPPAPPPAQSPPLAPEFTGEQGIGMWFRPHSPLGPKNTSPFSPLLDYAPKGVLNPIFFRTFPTLPKNIPGPPPLPHGWRPQTGLFPPAPFPAPWGGKTPFFPRWGGLPAVPPPVPPSPLERPPAPEGPRNPSPGRVFWSHLERQVRNRGGRQRPNPGVG